MTTEVNTTDVSFWDRLEQASDERTKGWFLVDSGTEVAFLVLAYLLMVWWGPRLMAKRKPFQINGLLMAYNFFLVALNAIIVKDIFVGSSRRGYGYRCHQSRNDFHPEEMRVVRAVWWYYMSKYIEFCDTLFFILRKKSDQLSGLHIYHHCSILIYSWSTNKWYPSGAFLRLPMLNSIVHVLMYSYYGLSACGPAVQKYLWWKKYLTSIQLVQFVIGMIWSLQSLATGCNHHIVMDLWNIVYMGSFLYLFGTFYLRKYTRKVKQ